jgi:NOL1/NOP2/fmu family ribosome biogenesis protein
MAKIIEREDTQASTEDVFAEQEQLKVEEQVTPSEPDIPDKYQNKSAKELVQMHQEAEKLLGRQSSEVGELRKVVDNYIQAQLTTEPQQQEQVEEVDFFTDPEKAVAQVIQNHPKIKEAESVSQQYRMQTALSALKTNHPDMESILQDTKFAEWIQGSKVRTKLFVAADKEYDYEAADELFNLWKERQQMIGQAASAEKQSRKQAVRTASTGNARGSSESSPKKIYRRADIIKLMKEDPHRYAALQDEIMRAYAEKRVK